MRLHTGHELSSIEANLLQEAPCIVVGDCLTYISLHQMAEIKLLEAVTKVGLYYVCRIMHLNSSH